MVSGSLYQRIQRLAVDRRRSPRWRSMAPLAVTLFIMGVATIRFSAMPAWVAAKDKPIETAAEPLPERAIARLGKNAFGTLATLTYSGALAFRPDSTQITVCDGATIRFFDVATARQTAKLTTEVSESGWVTCRAWAPDGKHVVCGTSDGRVIVRNVDEGKKTFEETLHDDEVRDIAWSPDGDLFATAGADGGIFVRPARDPSQLIRALAPGNLEPTPGAALQFSWDRSREPRPISLAFTSNGSKLLVAYDMGNVSVWDPREGILLRSFSTIEDEKIDSGDWVLPLHTVGLLANGETVLTAGETLDPERGHRTPMVRLWNLESGKRIADLIEPNEYGFGWTAPSPDGKRIVICLAGELVIRRIEDGRTLHRITLDGQWPREPTFSPDGKIVAVALSYGMALFDTKTGERLHHDEDLSLGPTLATDWSPSGDRVVTGTADGGVRVWNAATGELLWHRPLAPVNTPFGDESQPQFVAFSPDGEKVVAAGECDAPDLILRDGIMVVFDAATGKTLREVEIDEWTVRCGAVSHDGEVAVLATNYGGLNDTELYGIDVSTGQVLFRTPEKMAEYGLWDVQAIEFLPDSKSFRVATGDSKIFQFDAVTGKRLETHSINRRDEENEFAEESPIPQLRPRAFSRDAAVLVSSSHNTVSLWNAATGERQLRMEHPHQHGTYVGVSPDGTTIVTSDMNYVGDPGQNTIRLYDSEGNQLLTLSPHDARARVLAFSPDGSKLFTSFYHKAPIVWDVTRSE